MVVVVSATGGTGTAGVVVEVVVVLYEVVAMSSAPVQPTAAKATTASRPVINGI
ncbi:MAG TPA: hypothetical protein VGH29_08375 [Candidatus Binataceae bacterium]